MADIKDVLVPDVGGDEVEIIEICVQVGEDVEAETSLVTVESDKASMDIPAPFGGKISEILVKVGDKISQDALIMKIEAAGDDAPAAEAEPQAPAADETKAAEPQQKEAESAPAANTGASKVIQVEVPDIGTDGEVDVIDVLVAEGDQIEKEAGLITLETDKATMDVPSPEAGTVKSVKVKNGDKVSQGSLIIELETQSADAESAPAEQAAPAAAESAPAASTESKVIDVCVPDIGTEGEVDVIDVLVTAGDEIEKEAGLITLETDKATMDVPAPEAGVVKSVEVSTGGKVSQGSLIIKLEVKGAAAPQASAPAPSAESKPQPAAAKTEQQKAPPVPHHPSVGERPRGGVVHASPSVRRLAREFGVDLTLVKGSGRKGRILKEDVQSYVKYELSRPKMTASSQIAAGGGGLQVLPQPKVDFSKFGEVEEIPLTRIQKISGPNLHRNWVTIPHVTQFDEADITELEAFRKQQNAIAEKKKLGIKITPLVFMMKAVVDALKAYPVFNTSLSESGESLIQKKYYHVGIAVDTPGGLVVPVVRDVDQKGIYELSKELTEISIKARDGKLKAADMQGSCFTISSLGGIGGTAFTPIVNAPDVAILGVSKSEMKPKWNGKEFEPKLMLPLSLSYDHRVIDGAVAARFTVHLSTVLSDIRNLLL
ncbi:pyruvate dehydrogenase complex dihydrolipoyllysine-residue acetyltransferase [Neptunicella marina]|uniref:Acetyltransferase component of pyruvate dehydrogenase complex n=1 Tax=Neptunicella marina TaxID=2125989 RepID=A0A8J6M3E8_9ALTE|nr:pyruvate dehydrogenase complex dihydrolipoyllysine-residue acetyltransferase [Neptunicella marina]MBC3765321.1 pyruvate dehydrogenase complex dihydrolipoyllysine-residue acetyltransferase [Neptunicella marina]